VPWYHHIFCWILDSAYSKAWNSEANMLAQQASCYDIGGMIFKSRKKSMQKD
jgi:hypothetical protein